MTSKRDDPQSERIPVYDMVWRMADSIGVALLDAGGTITRDHALLAARTALEELREPTEAMIEAGRKAGRLTSPPTTDDERGAAEARRIFLAMIDAASDSEIGAAGE